MIVDCKNCNCSFNKRLSQINRTNNNFCSKSCAAIYNNKKFPKRKAKEYIIVLNAEF